MPLSLAPPTAANVTVNYTVQYNLAPCIPTDGNAVSLSVNVNVTCGSTALQVMEAAVNQENQDVGFLYRFKASYSPSPAGYNIEAISNIPDQINLDENLVSSACTWRFMVRTPEGALLLPSTAVSNYTFNDTGYGMVMLLYSDRSLSGSITLLANRTNLTSTPSTCSGTLGSMVVTEFAWHNIIAVIVFSICMPFYL